LNTKIYINWPHKLVFSFQLGLRHKEAQIKTMNNKTNMTNCKNGIIRVCPWWLV